MGLKKNKIKLYLNNFQNTDKIIIKVFLRFFK